jgi:hypothetical protein
MMFVKIWLAWIISNIFGHGGADQISTYDPDAYLVLSYLITTV